MKINIFSGKMWKGLTCNIYSVKQSKVMAQARAQLCVCPSYLTVRVFLEQSVLASNQYSFRGNRGVFGK